MFILKDNMFMFKIKLNTIQHSESWGPPAVLVTLTRDESTGPMEGITIQIS